MSRRALGFQFPVLFAVTSLVVIGCSTDGSSESAKPVEQGIPAVRLVSPGAQPEAVTTTEGMSIQDVADRQKAIDAKRAEVCKAHLANGRKAMEDGRFEEAAREFTLATEIDPSNKDAQGELEKVNAILGTPGARKDLAAQDAWKTSVARIDQAVTLARYHFNLAMKAGAEGNHAAEIENLKKALILLRANPAADADFNENQVKAALDKAVASKESADRNAAAEQLEAAKSIERQRADEERARVQRSIDERLNLAEDAFKREKFGECQRLCDEAIRLDFANERARKLKEYARRAELDSIHADNIARHREQWQRWIEEVQDIRVPQNATVMYPDLDKWRAIANRGPIELQPDKAEVSDVDAEIQRMLDTTILKNVDWQEKPLDEALKFIRNSTGKNVTIDRAVDEKVPAADRNLNLQFGEISAAAALKLAVESLKLRYVVEEGRIRITTPEEMRKSKVTSFYEVRDLTAKLNSYPGIDINLNPSGAGTKAPEEEGDSGEDNKAIEADRLIGMIRETVDKASWDEDPTNTIIDKNGTLVVKQTAENQKKIADLLGSLRKSTGIQVEIESRFVAVENNFLQEVGVDWRGLGDNSGGQGVPGQGTSAPFDDFGQPGATSVLGSDNSSGAYYSRGADGDIRSRSENIFTRSLGNPDTLTASGGFSLQATYLDNTQLEAILRAVQKYKRVNTVTAPRLVVANTQRANLQVLTEIAYVKDFDVEIAQGSVVADPVVDVVKEGVILDVRPTVSNDRRFVTLELRPTVASVVRPIRQKTTSLGTGSNVTLELPELKKESVKTTVVMPDGATLLLGGLKYFEEQDMESGIPILSDIPVLSFLFSRKGNYSSMKDLIILLKVKVLVKDEVEPAVNVGN